jgi:hypothetical protein
MPRWYALFQCHGKPKVLAEGIQQEVRLDHLSGIVPRICFEKRARGNFYMGIAVESEHPGVVPDQLQGLLQLSGLSNPIRQDGHPSLLRPFTLEEIRPMMGTSVPIEFAREIRYRRLALPPVEDPFGAVESASGDSDETRDHVVEQTHRFDRLLTWLSVVGNGGLAAFQSACRILALDADGAKARRILRRLRLLGHLECSTDGMRWSIAPTVLARTADPADEETYVLCGARSQALIQALRDGGVVEIMPQPGGGGPATVMLRDHVFDRLLAGLRAIGASDRVIIERSAAAIADLLPPLEQWPDMLQQVSDPHPHRFAVRRYDGLDVVPTYFDDTTGLYELWPEDGGSRRPRTLAFTFFYDAQRSRWLRGDWYGLRFLARSLDGERPRATYRADNGELSIPNEFRPPELYERALVLASGRLPSARGSWLVYEGIGQSLLDTLATKLRFDVSGG